MRKWPVLFIGLWVVGLMIGFVPGQNADPPQSPTNPAGGGQTPLTPVSPFPRAPGSKNPDPFFDPSYPERTRADGWPIFSDRLERWRKLRAERLKSNQGTEVSWRYLSSELKIQSVITLAQRERRVIFVAEPDKESLTLKVGDMLYDGYIREIGFERQDRRGLLVNIPFVRCEIREPKGSKRFKFIIYGD
jgi:hypothetical protein